jgi:NAD(P)-dependent dehydrogenase (short-subunit alcohol dehydrogenase family)
MYSQDYKQMDPINETRRGLLIGGALSASAAALPSRDRHSASRTEPQLVSSIPGESNMNPTYDFKGQVALVTGAAMGMGLAAARAFAACGGASVVLADRDGALAAREAARIVAQGGIAIGVACDVTDEAQIAAAVDRAVAEYGRLDMAFNNAGIQVPPSDAADEPAEQFQRVTAVNQFGVWANMKHELRVMREQGSGAIVNNSSLGGLVGLPGRAAYHGTKHAVLGMTKSAGVEYAPRGIRINAVCPGTIDTPMVQDMLKGQADAMKEIMRDQSIGRLGTADEVAAAVLWLCSPGASFVVGVGLPVDGGFTAH